MGSVENLKSYLFLIGYFLTERICLRPLARYRSYSGDIMLKRLFVLLTMHRRIMPLGSFEIENNFLLTMLM